MGAAPKPPDPIKPPKEPDLVKAKLNSLAFAEMERRIRATSGRAGSFNKGPGSSMPQNQFKTLLGQ